VGVVGWPGAFVKHGRPPLFRTRCCYASFASFITTHGMPKELPSPTDQLPLPLSRSSEEFTSSVGPKGHARQRLGRALSGRDPRSQPGGQPQPRSVPRGFHVSEGLNRLMPGSPRSWFAGGDTRRSSLDRLCLFGDGIDHAVDGDHITAPGPRTTSICSISSRSTSTASQITPAKSGV
jgi:hypothetical protein